MPVRKMNQHPRPPARELLLLARGSAGRPKLALRGLFSDDWDELDRVDCANRLPAGIN